MNKKKAHLAAFTANLIYGANFSIAKLIMPGMIRPNAFILLRVVFATLLFFFMYQFTKSGEKIERRDYFRYGVGNWYCCR